MPDEAGNMPALPGRIARDLMTLGPWNGPETGLKSPRGFSLSPSGGVVFRSKLLN